MSKFRKRLIKFNEQYHMVMHGILAVLTALFVHMLFPYISFPKTLAYSVVGSYLPDADHVLYFYLYGRRDEYAKQMRKFIREFQIKEFVKKAKYDHKELTSLYSHNVVVVALVAVLFFTLTLDAERYKAIIFAMASMLHFIYDISEDLLFFGQLNPNWVLKFSKKRGTK